MPYTDNNDLKSEVHETKVERLPIHWPRVFAAVLLIVLLGLGVVTWRHGEFNASGASAVPQEAYVPLKDFERYQQAATADIQDNKNKLQKQDAQIQQISEQIAQLSATSPLKAAAREAQASVQPAQKPAKKH